MSKHWDYEDDHDWDDDFDYAAAGYKYWYGKYYPADMVDSMFEDSVESTVNDIEISPVKATGIVAGVVALILGFCKVKKYMSANQIKK